jgi:CAAX prenyl protease-like protein
VNRAQSQPAWLASPVLPRALPFAIYIGFLALGPLLAPLLPDARWLYAIQIGATLAALVACAGSYVELGMAHNAALAARHWAVSVAAGVVVFVLWINLDVPWLSFGSAGGFDAHGGDGSIDWPLVAIRIFGAAAVVPVMEELFWRSLIMRWLDNPDFLRVAPAAVGLRALALSSLVFGFEHGEWFAGLLAGLAYGALYRWSGGLRIPILAHAVTNLLLGLWVVKTGNWQFW